MGDDKYHPGKRSNNQFKPLQVWDTGLGDDLQLTYSKHIGCPEDMEIEVDQQFYSWGPMQKCKFVSFLKKVKYCISQVNKAVVFQ